MSEANELYKIIESIECENFPEGTLVENCDECSRCRALVDYNHLKQNMEEQSE